MQHDIPNDSIPDQDGGGGLDSHNHGPDETGNDQDTRPPDSPALDDTGHRDPNASPMRSPGGEGPPGADEPTDSGPKRGGGGRDDGKCAKRPTKKDHDGDGPEAKKPHRRTKVLKKRKKEKDDFDDGGNEDESDTGSQQTTSGTGTITISSPSQPSEKDSDDDDDNLECGKPGEKAYFTFILHNNNNLSDTWKTAVARRKKDVRASSPSTTAITSTSSSAAREEVET